MASRMIAPGQALALYRRDLKEALGWAHSAFHCRRCAIDRFGSHTLASGLAAENVRIWSDMHFGSKASPPPANLGRPFATATDANAAMWQAWESVQDSETLLCLGDVIHLLEPAAVAEVVYRRVATAPGAEKILVVGNHDMHDDGRVRASGFDRMAAVLLIDGDPPLICTHAPLPEVPSGHVNVHGHWHNRLKPGRYINVCVEQLEYRPIGLHQVQRLARFIAGGGTQQGATTLEQIRRLP